MTAAASTRKRAGMDERFRTRRREVRRAAARRRRRMVIALVTVLVLLAGGFAVARSPLFAIAEVRVLGVAREQAATVREATALEVGENLLAADLAGAAARVTELSWVRSAEIARVPPSAVELRVVPRVPVAVVRLADSAWILDVEGVVVAGGEDDTLVAIDAAEAVLPGAGARVSDASVRNALAVHRALPTVIRQRVERYEAPSERGLRLLLRDHGGVWVRFGSAEQVDEKARVIELLIDQAGDQVRRQDSDPEAPEEADEEADAALLGAHELDVRAPDNPVLVPLAPAAPAAADE